MKKILIIANYEKSKGGISGQVEILLSEIFDGKMRIDLFNTRKNSFQRLILPLILLWKGKNYDIFHVHGCSFFGFYPIVISIFANIFLKKKIIITYHGGGLKRFMDAYPKFTRYFFLKTDILTVPSPYLFNLLSERGIDAKHLPNIIKEDNVSFKRRDNILPVFVVTRSLEKVYNIELVIEAFSIIKQQYSEAKLFIVGDGSLKSKLQKQVERLNLKDIEFLGRIQNSEIGNTLNKADIYINPTYADNMPISLFEAFACGLPVISTNVGGIPDFIQNNRNGFLVNSNDVQGLAKKMKYILLNKEKMEPIISNAYKTFKDYTWTNLESEYFKLYNC